MRERTQLAVGRRGVGPREQEQQRTQRASFVAPLYESTHKTAGHRAGIGCLVEKKYHVKRVGTSLRGQTRVSERRLGCLSSGPSELHSARRQT